MFTLGTKVISKKTGLPMTGTIVGTMAPIAYLYWQKWNLKNSDFKMHRWDELYPDWQEKPLFFVYFDNPAKNCTRKEFEKYDPQYYPKGMTYEEVPLVVVAVYPSDDLELFEEHSFVSKSEERA